MTRRDDSNDDMWDSCIEDSKPHSPHPGSHDQLVHIQGDEVPLIPDSDSSPHSPSLNRPNDEQAAADPIPNEDGLQTVTIDGLRVPKSIVDIIDLLTLRITSLEEQLCELEAGQVNEEQPQLPDEPAQAMVLPDYLPEDEPFHMYEPVEGHYLFYAGLSITIGIAAYGILGRYW